MHVRVLKQRLSAGRTAELNYERLLKRWRQHLRLPLLIAIFLMFLLAAVLWR